MAKSTSVQTGQTAQDIAAFLQKAKELQPAHTSTRGKLVFALDATMSRQPTWDRAQHIQAEMFAETQRIGGLDVQLVYFRGSHECRASGWVEKPQALARLMRSVDCQGGYTQIVRTLKHIRKQQETCTINAVVLVGDAMEEPLDHVCQLAGEIALQSTRIFTFQEGSDAAASAAFAEMARLTGGAHCQLDTSSPQMMRELLTAVAVYAAGGRAALLEHVKARGDSSTQLLQQLK